jgi:membrane protease YdiL (CAAX protease family)
LAESAGTALARARRKRLRGAKEEPVAEERLEPRDLKILLLWLLAGLLGVGVAWKYFFVAFPEASVDFRVSRPAALAEARNFLQALGDPTAGYRSTIVFDSDDTAKTYLERELGLREANRLMASEVNVWRWSARFFRSGRKEEYSVQVSPAGRVVGFSHVVEEDRAGARLDRDAALAVAEKFLRQRAGVDLSGYDFLPEEASSIERPRRRDWSFSWERHGFRAKGAPYRLRVEVEGDQASGFEQFLKVPEAWQRDFARLRSSNLLYQQTAQVFFALLYGAIVLVIIRLSRRGMARWSGTLRLGALLAVLFLIRAMNQWPLTLASYDTNSTFGSFFISRMGEAILASLAVGLSVALAMAAAEPLYRRDFPEKLRLGAIVTRDGIRSKPFFTSCVIGLMMAAAHIGFVAAFYVIGRRFGFWVPEDVKYTNTVSTAVPWISPLTIAIYAATNEEFLFRLFAIPYLLRLTRSRWVAVILPAFLWGFLHSAYVVEPGYARGLEVGLIGIVAGWVFLRWGIVATLVWHYTVDALLIGLFLLRSESLYFRLSGAVVAFFAVIPLGLAAVAFAARRRFAPVDAVLNRAKPLEPEAAAPVTTPPVAAPARYQPLSARARWMVVGAGALGILLAAAVRPQAIGNFVRLRVDARQALAISDRALAARRVDPSSFRHAVTFAGAYDPVANEYLRRQIGIAGANRILQDEVPPALWRVRYFRNLQKEEYRVYLTTDGGIYSIGHLLDEKAPGASVTTDQALARAEAFLRDEKKMDLSGWKRVEEKSKQRPARVDHEFIWEKQEAIGEAHVRMEVQVLGDEVEGYRSFVYVPDQWRRQLTRETTARAIDGIGRLAFFGLCALAVCVLFFRELGQPQGTGVPWRRISGWAAAGTLGIVLLFASNFQSVLAEYDTAWPFRAFLAVLLMGLVLVALVVLAGLFFLLGLGWFYLARAFGAGRLPGATGMPAAYYRDAFWLGLAGIGIVAGVNRVFYLVYRAWPTAQAGQGVSLPGGAGGALPALNVIAGALPAGIFAIGLLALLAGFLARYLRPRWLAAGFLLLLAASLVDSWGSPADFAKQFVLHAFAIGIYGWAVLRAFRFNLLGYFLALMGAWLASGAVGLLSQPNLFYRVNGGVVVAAIVALYLWPVVAPRGAPGTPDPPPVSFPVAGGPAGEAR